MLPCFMAGMLAYEYRDALPRSGTLAAGGLVALVATGHLRGVLAPVATDVLLPTTAPYALFYLAFSTQRFQAARYGDFSYGTYLYAFPIQQLLVAQFAARLPFAPFIACSMALALSAGIVSWYGVERWFLAAAHRQRSTKVVVVAPQPVV